MTVDPPTGYGGKRPGRFGHMMPGVDETLYMYISHLKTREPAIPQDTKMPTAERK